MTPAQSDTLTELRSAALAAVAGAADREALEAVRVRYLGRKGALTAVLRGLRELAENERATVGAAANAAKLEIEARFATREAELEASFAGTPGGVDVTLPGRQPWVGHAHLLHRVREELLHVFHGLGFGVGDGPEVEDDHHNFTALNLPPGHPAREGHDTYYLDSGLLLRTHTSTCWVRAMERGKPPLRLVFPGRVYRAESIDATHMDQFHQLDGLYVAERVTMAELRSTLKEAARRMFGTKTEARFVPLYFPFTEPSAQMDVTCILCGGSGKQGSERCAVCKATGWLEILGAGMVHPAVFRAVGYDPERVSGFAFGMGLERIALLRYRVPDIRYFLENDRRFLRQF